jgi:hypothetical protein
MKNTLYGEKDYDFLKKDVRRFKNEKNINN